ncbi:hypothetical protein PWT90_06559 [Aphanocladium album]|nr:hypothetical protein PWT90_06559 [Aphanocladium album]
MLAQLRNLRFDKIGSLMLGASSEAEPVVGSLLTFAANDLPDTTTPSSLPLTFATARAYVPAQYEVVARRTAFPAPTFGEADTRYELFALHSLRGAFESLIPDGVNEGPSALHHPDLRLGNILVDDGMKIRAVLDWEFAHVVPLRLSVPPSWATGNDLDNSSLGTLFRCEMGEVARADEELDDPQYDWYYPNANAFHIGHIMRYPGDLSVVFQRRFAKALFGDDAAQAETDFFDAKPALAAEAKRRANVNAYMPLPT